MMTKQQQQQRNEILDQINQSNKRVYELQLESSNLILHISRKIIDWFRTITEGELFILEEDTIIKKFDVKTDNQGVEFLSRDGGYIPGIDDFTKGTIMMFLETKWFVWTPTMGYGYNIFVTKWLIGEQIVWLAAGDDEGNTHNRFPIQVLKKLSS